MQNLSLSNNAGITGNLDALAGLSNLRVLSLANLGITGTLPAALKASLAASGGSVDLSGNPSLSACALRDNSADCAAVVALTGPTGAWSSIWPAAVRGTSYCGWLGVVCSADGQFRVTQLSLPGKSVAGSIPPSLGSLTRLQKLDLSGNALTGQIPDSFAAPAMNALQTLLLDNNQLSGTLPAALKALAGISNWSFFGNQLNDCGLKDSAADCAALLAVAASPWSVWAGLTGTSYCGWPGLTCSADNRVTGLDLSGIGLGATIPPAISSLSVLATLSLRNNLIGGSLPASLASLSALRVLLLDGNALTGTVPQSVRARSLQTVTLFGNQLQDCAVGDNARDCAALLAIASSWGLWDRDWNASGGSPICGGTAALPGGAVRLAPWPGVNCSTTSDRSLTSLCAPSALGSLGPTAPATAMQSR